MPWYAYLTIAAGAVVLLGGTARASGIIATPGLFVSQVWAALDRVRPGLSRNTKIIIVAQGALETGWGRIGTAPTRFNYWNVTVGSQGYRGPGSTWDGSGIPGMDKDANSNPKPQTWRAYTSMDDALRDWFASFISPSTRYASAYYALMAGDAQAYVQALKDGGYFEAPVSQYQLVPVAATVARYLTQLGA